MDLLPTSKLSFLNREGQTLEAPLEWQPGFLEVKVPKDKWEEVQLWRQGEELPVFLKRLGKKARVLTDWPRSNPGYYQLRLEYQGEVEEQIVTVWPLKISREAFAQMLEDLDTRVEHTINVYENQLVKLFFDLVNQRLRRVRYAFDADPKGKPLDEVRSLVEQLKKARRQAAFLDQVSQLKQQPNQITMVLLKRPLYHAALEGYLEFIRSPTVRLEESDLDAPLENLPHLYQVWGTLWIIQTLLEVAEPKGYQVENQCLVGRDKSGIYVRILPNNQPAISLIHPQHKTRVKLIPERTYGKDGELHSASVKLRPDIAVEIKQADGSQQVYLFDPKYKLDSEREENIDKEGKPKSADIQKMHTYHDAIQDNKARQLVCYAAILYPGSFQSYSREEIEALPTYPGREAELQKHLRRVLIKALNV